MTDDMYQSAQTNDVQTMKSLKAQGVDIKKKTNMVMLQCTLRQVEMQ